MNQHSHYTLLKRYLNDGSDCDWVLASIVDKQGSSYRTPGAIMLVNSLGQSFGLVSGGCLEADIVRRAKRVFTDQQASFVEYDMRDDESFAAELGIGCNGKIGLLILPIQNELHDLLQQLLAQLQAGKHTYLLLSYQAQNAPLTGQVLLSEDGAVITSAGAPIAVQSIQQPGAESNYSHYTIGGNRVSVSRIAAPTNFWIFGGGVDARPLANMASELGWRVTVLDHRTVYARRSDFLQAEAIHKLRPSDAAFTDLAPSIDAAVLMTHNLQLDADWLAALYKHANADYIGVLGPLDRRHKVEELAQINDRNWLDRQLQGPVGLDLGGELPESIALSILAQCHALLHQRNAEPLSGREICR